MEQFRGYRGGGLVQEPENDDAGERKGAGGEEISKVQIEGQDDPAFTLRESQDFIVRQTVKPLLAEVKHVVLAVA